MSPADRWLGIDFSGNAKQWGPGVSRSNVWVAEIHRRDDRFHLADVRRAQTLAGSGKPFERLAARLSVGDFRAAGIDAPFSVPTPCVPSRSHGALLRLVNALPTDERPFPTGAALLEALAPYPGVMKKPLRACESVWQARKVTVRSTMWNGKRGGAPFTAAALKLLAIARRPIWPHADSDQNGLLVEAFPAAQLTEWGVPSAGYSKAEGAEARRHIVRHLMTLLNLSEHRQTLEEHEDALDAVIAAFAAIAVTENRLAVPPGEEARAEGWIAVHHNSKSAAAPSTWNVVFDRFARFSAQPCLKASGPHFDRGEVDVWLQPLLRQSVRFAALLPKTPADLSQKHIDQILKSLGHVGTRTAGKRPLADLWKYLFRAIVLFRADYRCHFCGRSAEAGVQLSAGQRVALRLELDHISPRAGGGHDFLLSNIRATCRTCNVARGRMADEDFRAELKSLAAAVVRK